jgi:probable O-glycosylation ligase (exosortase A-associated)
MKGLILVYIITYASAAVALWNPLIGLYVYVGLSVLRPQFIFGFAGDLSGMSVLVGYGLLIGWALKRFGSWRVGRGTPIVLSLVGFVILYMISAVFALDTAASFATFTPLAKLILPFLAGVTLLEGEKDSRRLLWVLVLAQGYVGFEQNLNYLKGFNTAAEGFGGMDNNFFGASLVCLIGLAITLTLASKKWYQRLLAAAATALILHTTLLTYSRGAMIGLLAVATVAFILMPKRPKYIGGLVIVALIGVRFTGPQLAARYATAFASEDERDYSSESRVDLWRDCLKVVASYPVLGVGPANWRVVAATYGWPPGKSAHSVWMETAAEVGIPGVLMLMTFFGLAVVRLWPIARAQKTEKNEYESLLATGVILSIVGFVVTGQFVSAPGLEPPYYVTILGVALLKGTRREAAPEIVGWHQSLPEFGAVRFGYRPAEPPVVARR